MNPNQQPPNIQAAKSSGQNSRARQQCSIQPNTSQNSNSQNHNLSSMTPNQQGKISLRNNNTKKFYKMNTEGEEDNETSVLNSSKDLKGRIGDVSMRTRNLDKRVREEVSFAKNSRNEEQKRSVQGMEERSFINVNQSMNGNINNTAAKTKLSSKMPSSISNMANNSSVLTHYEQKFQTPANCSNTKPQGLSTITHSTNTPNNTNSLNQMKYFENQSTKSINLTGEEMGSMEQSAKDSSSSSFYERGGRNGNVVLEDRVKGGHHKQIGAYQNTRESPTVLAQDYLQQQQQNIKPATINYSKPLTNNNPSIMNSIRQQYQNCPPSYASTQMTKMTNSTSINTHNNLSNQNYQNVSSSLNNTPYSISHNLFHEQLPPKKNPSYYVNKQFYEKPPIQRQPSINKPTHLHNFNNNSHANVATINYRNDNHQESMNQHLLQKPNPQMVSFQPYEHQLNARSSLTVRHLEYGRVLQSEERTKSHTKNYSTTELVQNPDNYSNQSHNMSYNLNNKSAIINQQLPQMSQSQPYFSQDQSTQLSNNPYLPLVKNVNKSTDKTYILDSIQEKDEFNKMFVRNNSNSNSPSSNSKHEMKSESSGHNGKYIQRQKQDPKFNQKQHKIHLMPQNSMIRSYDPKYSSNQLHNDQTHNSINQNSSIAANLINLKYIKSPLNNVQEKLQLMDKGNKNYEKYLKVGHEKATVGIIKVHQSVGRQHQSSNQNTQQDFRHQAHSVNSSFKQNNKSETSSLYSYPKALHKQKPTSYIQYGNQPNQQPSMKNKHSKNYPIQIYSSNKNFHQLFSQDDSFSVKEEDMFRRTIDSSMKGPGFGIGVNNYRREEGKGLQSLGAYEARPQIHYQSQQGDDRAPLIRIQQAGVRFKSPDVQFNNSPHQLTKPNVNNLQIASPQYSPNKQTVFSPTQKSLQPAQKSYFLAQSEPQQNRQNARQKKSIKKMLVSQNKGIYQKPQVFYNYNFKDLLRGQHQQNRPNSRTILDAITKNQLTKIFCSTFKIGENQNGCDCIPKCYWVDIWIEKMHKNPLVGKESLMKNLDKKAVGLNFSAQNMWKNFNNDEAISFFDGSNWGGNSKLSKDEIETFKQIEKDIPRTCSDHPTFKGEQYRDFLRQLLINFYYLDPNLGYVQGMNIIGASITYHSRTVLQALQIMDYVMNVLNYKKIYLNDMQKCKELATKTCKLIRHYCYDMYNYVTVENEVDLEMFILGWYFSMMGTFVPLEAMHFVINKFVDQQFQGIVKIIVTYFIFIKDILMEKTDPNQIMQELSVQAMIERSKKIDWSQLITVSDKLHIILEKDKY